MKIVLRVWRQRRPEDKGGLVRYEIDGITQSTSFLEMMDTLNEQLTESGDEPVAFDSDCREGICGMCSMVINGRSHGPLNGTTTCQLYMRNFGDGEEIVVEPWRSAAFPVVRDLIVDRSAFDRITQAGGYVTIHSGPKPDPNTVPIEPDIAEEALDAAACIGCGACVAACPNASASLFVGAKISQLALLPQGKIEAKQRAEDMVAQMDDEMFGACTNIQECEAVCPKEISISAIAMMRREYAKAAIK